MFNLVFNPFLPAACSKKKDYLASSMIYVPFVFSGFLIIVLVFCSNVTQNLMDDPFFRSYITRPHIFASNNII